MFTRCFLLTPRLIIAASLLLCVCISLRDGSAGDISYVYDALGRLIAVTDPAGDTATYQYDAVGNLLGIARQSSSVLSVISFTPSGGPVGATVTIFGTGFSTTPAQNTVQFNGTAATVSSAAATQLVVTVPSGATTGTISVTVGGNTATSAAPFTVGAGSAPTISGFSPAMAAYGAPVTLTGTNFDATMVRNRVLFGGLFAPVTSASPTSLTVNASSPGHMTAGTLAGEATTTSDFFVLPAGVAASNIGYTGRISIGGAPVTAGITTAGRGALLLFDGVQGQRVTVAGTNITLAGGVVSFLPPNGRTLIPPSRQMSVTMSSNGSTLESPELPLTGTYTIYLANPNNSTGNITFTLSPELTGTIAPNGPAVPVSLSRVGQYARYTFPGTAGQQMSLNITSSTITGANAYILNPDGTTLTSIGFGAGGGFVDAQTLAMSGTYTILIKPTGTYTGNFTLTLYGFTDVTGSVTVNGSAVTPSITAPGQNARYTFAGTAGQWISAAVTNSSFPTATSPF